MRRFGLSAERILRRILKIDSYEVRDESLVRHRGRFCKMEVISLNEIEEWSVTDEMTFDIVDMEMKDGTKVRWLDIDDSLKSLLRRVAADRER